MGGQKHAPMDDTLLDGERVVGGEEDVKTIDSKSDARHACDRRQMTRAGVPGRACRSELKLKPQASMH